MKWTCPECGLSNNEYLSVCVCGYDSENEGKSPVEIWLEAYSLHYKGGDKEKAYELYTLLIDSYPHSREAGYAKQQKSYLEEDLEELRQIKRKREKKRRELQRKKEEERKELEEYEKLKAQKIQKLKDKKQYPSEEKSPELHNQLPSKKLLNIQDEKINESNVQRKDKISGKTLTFVFIAFAVGLGFKLFGTSSRIANMLISAISGGLGVVIGYAIVKGVNTLTVSKKQKTIIAWVIGIIGLVTVSLSLALLSTPNNFDACVAENIKNTSSEAAARAIYDACYKLFSAMTYDDYIKAGWKDITDSNAQEQPPQPGENKPTQPAKQSDPLDKWKKAGWIDITDATPVKTKKYYECVLNNMKGVSTDMAARTLINQCSKKYPTKYLKY